MGPETALVISAVVGAAASIQSGRASAQAAAFQAEEAKRQGEQTKIRALDDELNRRRELVDTLGEQAALGAQSGFDNFSMGSSFLALREETQRESYRDIGAIRLLGANQFRTTELNAAQARLAGSAAQTQGFLQATGKLASGAAQVYATRETT